MRIGICDDNEIYLNYLHQLTLQLLPDQPQMICEVLLPAKLKALIAAGDFPYDILITDIDLVEANAIDLVKELQYRNPGCVVIFISNYLQYALDVYEVTHLYFVLKNEAEKNLPKALDRAVSLVREQKDALLSIHYQHNHHQIKLSEIIYLESLGRYLTIHTKQQTFTCIRALKDIEKELNSFFGQCHKSFIVNYHYVHTLQPSRCITTTGITIPISYTYTKSFYSGYREYIVKHM